MFTSPKLGGWAFGELLTSAQMNQFNTDHPNAIDGVGGGTYALTAPLILNGDDVTIGDNLIVSGTITGPTISSKVTAGSARYTISGSAITNGNVFTLASVFADTGYVLASNTVQVPAVGRYLVTCVARLRNSDTTNPLQLNVTVREGGVAQIRIGGTRFSATAADEVIASGSYVADIAVPASEVIDVVATITAGDLTVQGASEARLTIARLSA